MESNSTQRLGCRAEFQRRAAVACEELDWEWEGDPPDAQRCRKHVAVPGAAPGSAISLTQSHVHIIDCLLLPALQGMGKPLLPRTLILALQQLIGANID